MRSVTILLAVFHLVSAALASEEEFLEWSEVRIIGIEREDTGRVTFSAQVQNDAWRKVEAAAFGKKYALDEQQCLRLTGFPLSSIKTTHEAGYEQLGGHTVHFRFRKFLYREATVVESEVVVSISRVNGLHVSELRERVVGEGKR